MISDQSSSYTLHHVNIFVSKYIKTCLGVLNIPGYKSNTVHQIIKLSDDKRLPIIWQMYHETINQNAEDEVLFTLEYYVVLWYKLERYEMGQRKFKIKDVIRIP